MAYQYDVFISYKRGELARTWIANFFRDKLRRELEVELGRQPLIFWDETVEEGQIPIVVIDQALRTSRCMVSLLSGPYFGSRYCLAEWETFKRRAEAEKLTSKGRTLTLPIQWHDGQSYKEVLAGFGPRARDFTSYRYESPAWTHTASYIDYERDLRELAPLIAELIETAPPFNDAWEVIEPKDVKVGDASIGEWTNKLSAGNEV